MQYEERREKDLLCIEKHKKIDEAISEIKARLKDHGLDIDELNRSDASHSVNICNLCDKLNDLVIQIRWLIGLLLTSMLGFFVYAVQQSIAK